MKIYLILALLIFFTSAVKFGITASSLNGHEGIDGIAAVVNNEVITYSQVRELMSSRQQAPEADRSLEKNKELEQAAIKDLIDRQLILQDFKKRELQIPEYVIEDRIQAIIREEFGGDRSSFIRTLKSQGVTLTKFQDMERDKIIVMAMRQTFVRNNNLLISPLAIQHYYTQHQKDYTTPDEVKLRMIVLRDTNDDVGLPGGKKAMAEEIRQKLLAGADFGHMAQLYSEDASTRETAGDWGWIDRQTLNQRLTDLAFSLRPGEMSRVVEISPSFYILKVEARKNAAVKSLNELRGEIEQNLMQQERIKDLQRWLDTLRQKAYIKIYS